MGWWLGVCLDARVFSFLMDEQNDIAQTDGFSAKINETILVLMMLTPSELLETMGFADGYRKTPPKAFRSSMPR